jgi:Carbohydrate-selective porin, OprB family
MPAERILREHSESISSRVFRCAGSLRARSLGTFVACFPPYILPCAKMCPGLYLPVLLRVCGAAYAQTAIAPLRRTSGSRRCFGQCGGSHSSESSITLGGPRRGAEHLVELNYKSNLTPWLLVQPVGQWFAQPVGNPTRQTVLVAGFRTKITF